MAKPHETETKTTRSVYRVNYTYIAANLAIRQGALGVEAGSPEEARELASDSLVKNGNYRNVKITKVILYG